LARYHPWRHLGRLTHITLRWTRDDDELDGALGWFYVDRDEIVMDSRQTQAQRRSTLAHELVHAERGDEPCGSPVLDLRQEDVVSKAAARRLIPDIRALGEVLAWAYDVHEAADELWVDPWTVRVRLDHLHPSERAYLRRRLSDYENGEPA
jgi:IrrE N-terminal-like domain